jgi:alcohol dehydrogenase class IV
MEFNQPAVAARLAEVAVAMGVPASATGGARGFGDDEMAARGIAAVRALSQACGLPQRLGLVGVQRDGFAQLANDASGDAMMISNPRPATEDEIVALYEQAF